MKQATLLAAALIGLGMHNRAHAATDNFENATVITGSSLNFTSVSILNYTSQAGEPPRTRWGEYGAKKTAWWKWTAPEDGFCTVDTLSPPNDMPVRDTLVAVYTGASVNALTLIADGDDHWTRANGAAANGASCTFYATKGVTYHIAVDGYHASSVTATAHNVTLRLGLLPKRGMRKYGVYRIVLADSQLHGTLSFTKTSAFSFSAKFTVGKKAYPLKGVLTPEGFFMTAIERKTPAGAAPLPPIGLIIDAKAEGDLYVGEGRLYGARSNLMEAHTFPAGVTTTVAGKFTGVLNTNGSEAPGVVCATVKGNGMVTLAGLAADGSKLTFSGPLVHDHDASATGTLPVCVSLYGGGGFVRAHFHFTDNAMGDRLEASQTGHFRPANPASVFYPAGIDSSLVVLGGSYAPEKNKRALDFLEGSMGAGKLSIPASMDEIASMISENLAFDTKNKFIFPPKNARKPALKLNASGLVTGSFLDDNGKKRVVNGVLYRFNGQTLLRGQVAGATKNVLFQVIP